MPDRRTRVIRVVFESPPDPDRFHAMERCRFAVVVLLPDEVKRQLATATVAQARARKQITDRLYRPPNLDGMNASVEVVMLRGCLKSCPPCEAGLLCANTGAMSTQIYATDLNDAAWAWVAPYLPEARPGGRPRTTDLRAVLNAIFYLLRTGCQWCLLPREFPRPGTVHHYFRAWKAAGVLAELQRALHEQARLSRGRSMCPSVVILDSQSLKTTERGGVRGFDGHKRVNGRKRHLLVDTLGMVVARSVEAANVSDQCAGARLNKLPS